MQWNLIIQLTLKIFSPILGLSPRFTSIAEAWFDVRKINHGKQENHTCFSFLLQIPLTNAFFFTLPLTNIKLKVFRQQSAWYLRIQPLSDYPQLKSCSDYEINKASYDILCAGTHISNENGCKNLIVLIQKEKAVTSDQFA